MRFFLSSSQQNGELLPISSTRLELVDEAETSLSSAGLAVELVSLFLSVAGSSVDAGALAERIGVTNSGVPTLELVGAVIHVLGVTITDGTEEGAAESRNSRRQFNTPAFNTSSLRILDQIEGVKGGSLVVEIGGLGEDLGNTEVVVAAEDHAVAVIQTSMGAVAVQGVVASENDSSLASLVAQASSGVAIGKA